MDYTVNSCGFGILILSISKAVFILSSGEYPLDFISVLIYLSIYSVVYLINVSLSTISSQARQSLSIDQWNDSTSLSQVGQPGGFVLCFLKCFSINNVKVLVSGVLPFVLRYLLVNSNPLSVCTLISLRFKYLNYFKNS